MAQKMFARIRQALCKVGLFSIQCCHLERLWSGQRSPLSRPSFWKLILIKHMIIMTRHLSLISWLSLVFVCDALIWITPYFHVPQRLFQWIMYCSPCIHLHRSIKQGCALAPYLFVLTADVLGYLLKEARVQVRLRWISHPREDEMVNNHFGDDSFINSYWSGVGC